MANPIDPSGIEYSVLKSERPQIGDSFYYERGGTHKIDVLHDTGPLREGSSVISVVGARYHLLGNELCHIAFPYLDVLNPDSITDALDLYYNTGGDIFIRMGGIYYQRAVGGAWNKIEQNQAPDRWAILLNNQKEIFRIRLQERELL